MILVLMLPNAYSHCLFTVTVYVPDMKSRSAHAFMCVMVVVVVAVCVCMCVCVCVCVCMEWVFFVAIVWDETSILVAVHFSMKNIYKLWSGPSRDVEQRRRQPITFFVYWRLRDVGRVSPWR